MTPLVDKDSVSYRMGFESGRDNEPFRHPCSGNPRAENNYYFGFLAGQAAAKGDSNV